MFIAYYLNARFNLVNLLQRIVFKRNVSKFFTLQAIDWATSKPFNWLGTYYFDLPPFKISLALGDALTATLVLPSFAIDVWYRYEIGFGEFHNNHAKYHQVYVIIL